MTIEDQITALLAEAAPLRLLPDDEAESMGLPGIVDMINALRMVQASGQRDDPMKPASGLSQVPCEITHLTPVDSPLMKIAQVGGEMNEHMNDMLQMAEKPKRGRKPKAD